jgi:hypothetical protein
LVCFPCIGALSANILCALRAIAAALLSGAPVALIVTREIKRKTERKRNGSDSYGDEARRESSYTSVGNAPSFPSSSTTSSTTSSSTSTNSTFSPAHTVRTSRPAYVSWSEVPLSEVRPANTFHPQNPATHGNTSRDKDRNVNGVESDGNIIDRTVTLLSSLFQEKYGNSTISGADLFQNLCGAYMFDIDIILNESASNYQDKPESVPGQGEVQHSLKLETFSSASAVDNGKKNRKNLENRSAESLYRNSDMHLANEALNTLVLSQCAGCLTTAVQRLAACVASFPVLQRVHPVEMLERELQKCVDQSTNTLPPRTPHSAAFSAKISVSDPYHNTVARTALELFEGFVSMVNQSTSRCISR